MPVDAYKDMTISRGGKFSQIMQPQLGLVDLLHLNTDTPRVARSLIFRRPIRELVCLSRCQAIHDSLEIGGRRVDGVLHGNRPLLCGRAALLKVRIRPSVALPVRVRMHQLIAYVVRSLECPARVAVRIGGRIITILRDGGVIVEPRWIGWQWHDWWLRSKICCSIDLV